MATPARVRELNEVDRQRIDDVLSRFRTEFDVWSDDYENVWELLGFVQYEGIDLPIVREAEPLIKGQKSVALHDAQWCMLAVGNEWHLALDHEDFTEPVDLTKFNRKHLKHRLSQKWQRILLRQEEAL